MHMQSHPHANLAKLESFIVCIAQKYNSMGMLQINYSQKTPNLWCDVHTVV